MCESPRERGSPRENNNSWVDENCCLWGPLPTWIAACENRCLRGSLPARIAACENRCLRESLPARIAKRTTVAAVKCRCVRGHTASVHPHVLSHLEACGKNLWSMCCRALCGCGYGWQDCLYFAENKFAVGEVQSEAKRSRKRKRTEQEQNCFYSLYLTCKLSHRILCF